MIQELEKRTFLSSAILLDNDTLIVQGSPQNDTIYFQCEPGEIRVVLNGLSRTYGSTQIKQIRISAGDGDDRVILSSRLKLDATIFGNDGNDTLGGGSGNDTIYGGQGDDQIEGQLGHDYLDGQRGDDEFLDYRGINVFHGGSGNDTGLVDTWLFGSGMESRRMAAIRDGVVGPYDIYDVTPRGNGSGTNFRAVNGRMILEYFGATGSGANQVSYTDVLIQNDGSLRVDVRITTPAYGLGSTADMKYFIKRWDVTKAIENGLTFVRKSIRPGSVEAHIETTVTKYSVPLLLPASAGTDA